MTIEYLHTFEEAGLEVLRYKQYINGNLIVHFKECIRSFHRPNNPYVVIVSVDSSTHRSTDLYWPIGLCENLGVDGMANPIKKYEDIVTLGLTLDEAVLCLKKLLT